MKKPIRTALSLLLVLAFSLSAWALPALAYSETLTTGTTFVEVEAQYLAPTDNRAEIEKGADSTRVYHVTLEWDPSGTILYNAGRTIYSWNEASLRYDTQVTGKGWTIDAAKLTLTVKNRSNRPVDVVCGDPVPLADAVLSGFYDHATMALPSAATGGFEGTGVEQSARAVYTVTGVTGEIVAGQTQIASITVTVTGR